MNKQEFIEKLKMHGAWCTDCHDINGKKDIYVKSAKVRELLEQIDEPQAEEVEVPDFVAEWYETNKASIERAVSMQIQHGFTPLIEPRSKFDMWFFDESNHPIETLIRMKDGYTVKPKRWVVKSKDHIGLESFVNGTVNPMWTTEEPLWMTFTDKAKAEAVAVLVEGTVEEV